MTNPRIISGKAKGMRLQAVPGDISRPVTDRVKEAVFNILGPEIAGASMLDLFAGTGSIGIEALSRGASFVRLNDLHRQAVATIRANLKHTRLEADAEVTQQDAFALLRQPPDRVFDYIYIAPPQYKGMWKLAMQTLDEHTGWLAEDAWVIVQIDPLEYEPLELEHLVEFERRKYGSTLIVFFERRQSEV
jgi:16S rRNA (guanine(966)-N(2))-methyltransferase RsmD